jgi:hypothetical protein
MSHDRIIISSGLDGVWSVACDCGQSWTVRDLSEGQSVGIHHATLPNVGDPVRFVRRLDRAPLRPPPNPWVLAHSGAPRADPTGINSRVPIVLVSGSTRRKRK